jgi:hypothetical protein
MFRCRGNRQILITESHMKTFLCFAVLSLTMFFKPAWADSLQDCSDQFIGGDINNAPTLYDSDPTQPYGNNVHLCFKDDNVSFFALEYWPEEFSPRWAAYRLDPANYGADGCNTFTRAVGNCYIRAPTWQEALDCDNDNYKSDPFLDICIYNAMANVKKGGAQTDRSSRGALPASSEYPQGCQSLVQRVDTHCLALNSPVCVWQATILPHLDSTAVRRKENALFGDADICGGAF